MKVKKMFLMLLFCASSMIVFTSCNKENKLIEYWKVYFAEKRGTAQWYLFNDDHSSYFKDYKEPYLQKRFESLFPNPNENQNSYFSIAKDVTKGVGICHCKDDKFLFDVLKKIILQGKCGQKAKSNPDLFTENVCKIIGPIDDFKKELASYVNVKKVKKESDSGINRFYVLYSIEDEIYVICVITDKGNGQSEMKELSHSMSINDILNEWSYLVEG